MDPVMDKESVGVAIRTILDQQSPDEEKSEAYFVLSSRLKTVCANAPVPEEIHSNGSAVVNAILRCICSRSPLTLCSLQTLGYILFNEPLVRSLSGDTVQELMKVILNVITAEDTTKVLCTRALWCISSQNIDGQIMKNYLCDTLGVIQQLKSSDLIQTSSVASEVLGVLSKLYVQCKTEFLELMAMWYEIVIHVLFTKHVKVQQKALSVLLDLEEPVKGNPEMIAWLHKELKNNLIVDILQLFCAKAVEPKILLQVWCYFVRVLGKSLHKSGSFLNNMLKVVENGFKHRSLLIQVEAYTSWKTLIDGFSLDTSVLTNQKRVNLLLMPLISCATKQRFVEVDEARLATWWHLIVSLLPHSTRDSRCKLFQQVVSPFLLFCLGLNPKSAQSEIFRKDELTPRKIYTSLLSHTVMSSHYPFQPSTSFLSTGCLAILLLLGIEDMEIKEALIPRVHINVSGEIEFSLDVSRLFLVFLEGLLTHLADVDPDVVKAVVYYLLLGVCSSLKEGVSFDLSQSGYLLSSVLDILTKIELGTEEKISLFCSLSKLPSSLLLSATLHIEITQSDQFVWKKLLEPGLHLLLCRKDEKKLLTFCNKMFFLATHTKQQGGIHLSTQDCLSHYQQLLLFITNACEEKDDANSVVLGQLWCSISEQLLEFFKESGQIQRMHDAMPVLVRLILQFPLQYELIKENSKTIISAWKKLYYITRVNLGLHFKDPNLPAKMVSEDMLKVVNSKTSDLDEVISTSEDVLAVDNYVMGFSSVVSSLLDSLSLSDQQQGSRLSLQTCSLNMASILKCLLDHSNSLLSKYCRKTNVSAVKLTCLPLVIGTATQLYNNLLTNEVILSVSKTLVYSLALLIKAILSEKELRSNQEIIRKLWATVIITFESRYDGPYSSALLATLSPLFEVTFLSKWKALVSDSFSFWCCTFGKVPSSGHVTLVYPQDLRTAMTKILSSYKSFDQLPLPDFQPLSLSGPHPFSVSDDIEEYSEENERAIVLPHTPVSHRSPVAAVPVSPFSKTLKTTPTSTGRPNLEDEDSQDFVVIGPPEKKKRLLTEHQKEKKRQRNVDIPVLYNTIEPSTDTQDFFSEDSQLVSADRMVINEDPEVVADSSTDCLVSSSSCIACPSEVPETPPDSAQVPAALSGTCNPAITSETSDTAPVTSDTTPVPSDTTPVTSNATPVTSDTTPASDDTAPVTSDTAPVTSDTTPVTSDATSNTAPVTSDTTPVTSDTAPVTSDTTPVTSAPVTSDSTPVTSAPVTSDTTPVTSAPVTSDSTPVTTNNTVSVIRNTASLTNDTVPVTSNTAPVTISDRTPVVQEVPTIIASTCENPVINIVTMEATNNFDNTYSNMRTMRKRGRPRLKSNVGATSSKRGRGRPSGPTDKGSPVSSKRGRLRGRPRKNITAAVSHMESIVEKETQLLSMRGRRNSVRGRRKASSPVSSHVPSTAGCTSNVMPATMSNRTSPLQSLLDAAAKEKNSRAQLVTTLQSTSNATPVMATIISTSATGGVSSSVMASGISSSVMSSATGSVSSSVMASATSGVSSSSVMASGGVSSSVMASDGISSSVMVSAASGISSSVMATGGVSSSVMATGVSSSVMATGVSSSVMASATGVSATAGDVSSSLGLSISFPDISSQIALSSDISRLIHKSLVHLAHLQNGSPLLREAAETTPSLAVSPIYVVPNSTPITSIVPFQGSSPIVTPSALMNSQFSGIPSTSHAMQRPAQVSIPNAQGKGLTKELAQNIKKLSLLLPQKFMQSNLPCVEKLLQESITSDSNTTDRTVTASNTLTDSMITTSSTIVHPTVTASNTLTDSMVTASSTTVHPTVTASNTLTDSIVTASSTITQSAINNTTSTIATLSNSTFSNVTTDTITDTAAVSSSTITADATESSLCDMETGYTVPKLATLAARLLPQSVSSRVLVPSTPTHHRLEPSPKCVTPIGILKYVSQFDTPVSVTKGRHVQFANPVIMGKQDAPRTPRAAHEEGRVINKSTYSKRKSPFSSRRTLQLSNGASTSAAIKTNVSEVPSTPPSTSPVFPSLARCDSPVEQILPSLSPSGRYTHGLYNVIHAKNITTIGDLSSLSEQEISSLPIRSPKVDVLRTALRNFETDLNHHGSNKRKQSRDSGPSQKRIKLSSFNEESPPTNSSDSIIAKEPLSQLGEDREDPLVTISTPNSQLTQKVVQQNDAVQLEVVSNGENVPSNDNATMDDDDDVKMDTDKAALIQAIQCDHCYLPQNAVSLPPQTSTATVPQTFAKSQTPTDDERIVSRSQISPDLEHQTIAPVPHPVNNEQSLAEEVTSQELFSEQSTAEVSYSTDRQLQDDQTEESRPLMQLVECTNGDSMEESSDHSHEVVSTLSDHETSQSIGTNAAVSAPAAAVESTAMMSPPSADTAVNNNTDTESVALVQTGKSNEQPLPLEETSNSVDLSPRVLAEQLRHYSAMIQSMQPAALNELVKECYHFIGAYINSHNLS